MILVAGGTGRLGRLVVGHLRERGLPVRVLTRDPERARKLLDDDLDIVFGDVRDASSLPPALAGASLVVSAVHGFADGDGSPATVDRDGNAHLIDAARQAGSDVVLLSVVEAAEDSPMELFRMKYEAEQYLRRSGVPFTIVRATAFLELWVDLLRETAGRSGRPVVFGRGENPINFVSVADVADLVARVVADPEARGRVLEIGGPSDLTFLQLAEAVQSTDGSSGRPRHVPRLVLRFLSQSVGRVRPLLGRQMRAALEMDRLDLTSGSGSSHDVYPDLPCTRVEAVLAG